MPSPWRKVIRRQVAERRQVSDRAVTRAAVRELRERGLIAAEIAAALGLPEPAVRRWLGEVQS